MWLSVVDGPAGLSSLDQESTKTKHNGVPPRGSTPFRENFG